MGKDMGNTGVMTWGILGIHWKGHGEYRGNDMEYRGEDMGIKGMGNTGVVALGILG